MKRILPAQAEERMQCAGVAEAFRACWQAKRAESSSCGFARYSVQCGHAIMRSSAVLGAVEPE